MEHLLEVLATASRYIISLLGVYLAVVASAHVIVNKRDSRAAVAWVGLIWLVPVLGAVLYLILGINRIRRRAGLLRAASTRPLESPPSPHAVVASIRALLPPSAHGLVDLARLVDSLERRPLLAGNAVEALNGGDEAYARMLGAIDAARESVTLTTFIFDNDATGRRFADALGRAVARGVAVRVLIDDVGARYSWPSISPELERRQVPMRRFLPTLVPLSAGYMNLRNHRKILVVDGRLGFTGGMNLREGHRATFRPAYPIIDVHFAITGPVVAQLQQVFCEDWSFASGEVLGGPAFFPELARCGPIVARGIADGPDEDYSKLRWTLHGAIACARSSLRIVTPYFLPGRDLVTALNVAVMRGVSVTIVLPEANNLRLVKWASTALLWQVLEHGCRVYMSPPPFDHSKILVVDDTWSLIGSGNWDPRSLRLNFEFNVECYDAALARTLAALVDAKVARAREVTLEEVDSRPPPVKLRDGLARLFTPYL